MAEADYGGDYQIRPPHHQKFKCGVVKVGPVAVVWFGCTQILNIDIERKG